jgi:hypothetical protein
MQRVFATTVPLAASAVLTGPWTSLATFSVAQPLPMAASGGGGVGGQPTLSGSVFSNQAGSVVLQQTDNPNNTNLTKVLSTTAVVASTLLTITPVNPTALYWRVVYTNGSTIQTTFELYIDLIT